MRQRDASRREALSAAARLLRPRLPRLALAITFGVLALGSALALAAVAAWLITRAWQMPPVLDLTIAVVAVRAFGISRGVLGYCERLASHDVALDAATTARAALYRRLVAAPSDVVLRSGGGELVSRFGSSVDDLADVLVRAVLPIAVAAVLGVAAVGVIAVVSMPAAALLALCLMIAGVVAPRRASKAATDTELIAARHHTERDRAALLALEHAPELRVNGRLEAVISETIRRQHEWGRMADAAARPAAFAAAAPTAAIGVSALGTIAIALAIAPAVAPTTLAILLLLPLSAFEATTALPAAAVALTRARIAITDLDDLTAPRPDGRRRPDHPAPEITPGTRLAVTGPSGSGKTTLLLATAQSCGGPPTAGYFAEDAHVFETTIRDNLLVARGDADDEELVEALTRSGLGEWLGDLPDGLSTVLVGGADALSAGQRRRLLLARALVSHFSVVLLDEPTEHLDATDGRRLLDALLTRGALFAPDRAVVVATHHLPSDAPCEVIGLAPDR